MVTDEKQMEVIMRKVVLVPILGMFLLFFATTHVSATETTVKLGIVDLNKAVNESSQGKKATVELESAIKGKQEELDGKGKAFEKLKSQIDAQGSAMSAEVRKNKEDELERLTREYQRELSDSRKEMQKKENELTGHIVKELREIINIIAHEDRYDLIIDKIPTLVLFEDNGLDITDKVIKKLYEKKK
jgi:outer membrane protein